MIIIIIIISLVDEVHNMFVEVEQIYAAITMKVISLTLVIVWYYPSADNRNECSIL